ncbi:hypothetical protein [Streptomyces chattanoogensis]|uniref:hypothetical protein n=1 Tax=Streptomyces chattanoogensis TaxID=66876 RepID=UPI0036A41050
MSTPEGDEDDAGPVPRRLLDEIIDEWTRRNPDTPRPSTLKELAKQWFGLQKSELSTLPAKRVEILSRDSRQREAWARQLVAIPLEHEVTVKRAVRSSYWSVNSRSSWVAALVDFIDRHPGATALAFPIFFATIGPMVFSLIDERDFNGFKEGDILATATIALLIFAFYGMSCSLARRGASWIIHAWRISFFLTVVTLLTWQGWHPFLFDRVRDFMPLKGAVSSLSRQNAHLDVSITYPLRAMLFVLALQILFRMVYFLVRLAGPREPAHAVATSQLILELLHTARIAQGAKLLSSAPVGHTVRSVFDLSQINEPDEADEPPAGFRPYMGSEVRKEIILSLERFALLVEGRWRRSLKTGDRAADSAVATLADGISVAARRWKKVAAVGGQEQLAKMSESITQALTEACLGNWESLAAEVTTKEILSRRLLQSLRHVAALIVMVAAVALVTMKPFSWTQYQSNPVLDSLILILAGTLCLSIDPSLGERIGNAGRLVTNFSTKKS